MKQVTVKNLKKVSAAVCALGILAGALVLPVKAMAAETEAPVTITLPAPFTKDGEVPGSLPTLRCRRNSCPPYCGRPTASTGRSPASA